MRWPGGSSRLRVSQHRGDRVLGEPVDLEVGLELAQLVGDRQVAADVAEADRRGDVEDASCGGSAPRVHVSVLRRSCRRPVRRSPARAG